MEAAQIHTYGRSVVIAVIVPGSGNYCSNNPENMKKEYLYLLKEVKSQFDKIAS